MDSLTESSLGGYIEKLSSDSGTPGGGNALGVIGSMACALLLMSLRIAVLKKDRQNGEALAAESRLLGIQKKMLSLAEEDSARFKEVLAAWRQGGEKLQAALKASALVSLEIAEKSCELLDVAGSLDLGKFANIITDVGISSELAGSCFRGGMMNYHINAKGIGDKSSCAQMAGRQAGLESGFAEKYGIVSEKIKAVMNG
ncbi:MAG: cyclodeaminase/cyclohydrolase family protein [Elusimicrobia bacterium]|nr:cyclodeaminase/cyclohydrolase family protein [Elusimicrobiota bacterium]